DPRSEKVGYKIRQAEMEKVPYMLVVGDKERDLGQVAVRQRQQGDLGPMGVEDFLSKARAEIGEKR
ncbi:MAG: His/Gly/Thr/Pro-type tRNA ligase C-terminal domain-containing protein, partial [Firmicutes bacterium]|nr:His/Gly/Thr/Pro-type tRNA ligase C-terminal domain-containing protein [Bacillota bacterium]